MMMSNDSANAVSVGYAGGRVDAPSQDYIPDAPFQQSGQEPDRVPDMPAGLRNADCHGSLSKYHIRRAGDAPSQRKAALPDRRDGGRKQRQVAPIGQTGRGGSAGLEASQRLRDHQIVEQPEILDRQPVACE